MSAPSTKKAPSRVRGEGDAKRDQRIGFWAKMPNAVVLDHRLSDAAVRLYNYLLIGAGTQGVYFATGGQAEIAEDLGWSRSGMQRAQRKLTDAGWVTTKRSLAHRTTLEYRLVSSMDDSQRDDLDAPQVRPGVDGRGEPEYAEDDSTDETTPRDVVWDTQCFTDEVYATGSRYTHCTTREATAAPPVVPPTYLEEIPSERSPEIDPIVLALRNLGEVYGLRGDPEDIAAAVVDMDINSEGVAKAERWLANKARERPRRFIAILRAARTWSRVSEAPGTDGGGYGGTADQAAEVRDTPPTDDELREWECNSRRYLASKPAFARRIAAMEADYPRPFCRQPSCVAAEPLERELDAEGRCPRCRQVVDGSGA